MQGPWHPPADVYRTRDGWLAKLELAGVRPDEIELQLAGTKLRVAGVRRDFVIREAKHAHPMEISYNRFERTIEFVLVGRIEDLLDAALRSGGEAP